MSAYESLVREINTHLDDLASRQYPWVAPWIAKSICAEHADAFQSPDTSDDDRAFWECTGYAYTRKLVTEQINKRAQGDQAEQVRQQLALPGFERTHLQDYYVVEREGLEQGICVLNLTDDEIDAKVAIYRRQAETNLAHADELVRFKAWRAARRMVS